jgi:hypothetical protein
VFIADAVFPQRGEHVGGDVLVVPIRQRDPHQIFGHCVVEARGIVGQHHSVRMPALTHLSHGVYALFKRAIGIDSEPVHADLGAVVDQFLEVVKVGSVATMADDHAGQVHTLLREHPLLI